MTGINFKDLYNEAGKLVPLGEYDTIVTKVEATTASTGKPMIKAQFVIEEGQFKNRTLFSQFTLSAENPNALRMWFNQMKQFGMEGAFWDTNPSLEDIAQNILGKRIRCVVNHREWQGNMRENVDGYKPSRATGPIPPGMVNGSVSGGSATSSSPTPPNPSGPVPPSPSAQPASQPNSSAPPLPAF